MSTHHKSKTQKKPVIECGFGERCARRNCTFNHPDTRNLETNLHRVQQEKREELAHLEQRQTEMINRDCSHWYSCPQPSCLFRHPHEWNPWENQRLAEIKRRVKEKQAKEQRQHALNVCGERENSNSRMHGQQQRAKQSMAKNSIGDDYQYDDEYFGVYEEIWQKQTEKQVGKW